jgi:hypothetical protein
VALSPVPEKLGQSDAEGDLLLTLMVLSGDNISFTTGISEPVSIESDISAACSPVFEGREKPVLVWAFAPNVGTVGGDYLVEAVSRHSCGAPVFGGFAVDDSPTFQENCFVITPEGDYRDRVGFVLLYGDIQPEFYRASITEKRIFDRWYEVTEANGDELISVNDRSALDFLDTIGMTPEMTRNIVLTNIVLAVQEDESSYFPRQIINLSDNNTIILGGTTEKGTRFRVGGYDKDDMISAARSAVKNAADHEHGKSFALVYSCASRLVLLGSESLDEIHMLREEISGLPFLMAYAGGEICPFVRSDGSHMSRFQNGSFIICAI